MKLKDTIELMQSEDYKDRLKAEYWQTKIRYEKLKAANNKTEINARIAANLSPAFITSEAEAEEAARESTRYNLLREQQRAMGELLHVLELRAELEGIEL